MAISASGFGTVSKTKMTKIKFLCFSVGIISSISLQAESIDRTLSGAGVVVKAWREEEQRQLEQRRLELEVEKMNREAEIQKLEYQRKLQQLQQPNSRDGTNLND